MDNKKLAKKIFLNRSQIVLKAARQLKCNDHEILKEINDKNEAVIEGFLNKTQKLKSIMLKFS